MKPKQETKDILWRLSEYVRQASSSTEDCVMVAWQEYVEGSDRWRSALLQARNHARDVLDRITAVADEIGG